MSASTDRPAAARSAVRRRIAGLFLALGMAAWLGYLAGAALHDDSPLPVGMPVDPAVPVRLDLAPAPASAVPRLQALAGTLARHPRVQVVDGDAVPAALADRVAARRALLHVRLALPGGQVGPPAVTLHMAAADLPGLVVSEQFEAAAGDEGTDTLLAQRIAERIAATRQAPR